MKKELGDLTIREAIRLCKDFMRDGDCKFCPFADVGGLYCFSNIEDDEKLEEKIET